MNSIDQIRNSYNDNDLRLRDALDMLSQAESPAQRAEILTEMASLAYQMADQRTLWDLDDDNPGLLESHAARLFRLVALTEATSSRGSVVLLGIDPLQCDIDVDAAMYALTQADTPADRVDALLKLAAAVHPHVGPLAAGVLHNVAKAYQAPMVHSETSVLEPDRQRSPRAGWLVAWVGAVLGVAVVSVTNYAVAWLPQTAWTRLAPVGIVLLWMGTWLLDPDRTNRWSKVGWTFTQIAVFSMMVAFLGWSRWIPSWFAQMLGMPHPFGVSFYAVLSTAASVAAVVCHAVGVRRSS